MKGWKAFHLFVKSKNYIILQTNLFETSSLLAYVAPLYFIYQNIIL